MVDGAGAGISLGKDVGNGTTVELDMINSEIDNCAAYTWDNNGYGGGMFIGKGSTINMTGGHIKGTTKSNNAAGIFNLGKLTIGSGAEISNNHAYQMVGGIYNDGYLKIDDANIKNNHIEGFDLIKNKNTSRHILTGEGNEEFGGENIYAAKDVIITPNATFDVKDVRILDGQSKIILTGALTKQINVSISEKEKTTKSDNKNVKIFAEGKKRKVGYLVAVGDGTYKPTAEDAKKIHYVSKDTDPNQPRAEFTDHTSPGMWDYVLNPEDNNIVLGQRVKLVYHGNTGKIGENDSEEKTVDVYKIGNFWEKQLDKYKVADPTKDRHEFMGWYFWIENSKATDTNNDKSIQDLKYPETVTNDLFDFSKVDFSSKDKEEIVDIITPNVINTYAGWSENIELGVQKTWEDAEESDKTDVNVTLKGGEKDEKATLTSTNNYYHSFVNLSVFNKSYEPNEEKNMNLKFTPREYKVEEVKLEGFKTSYSPDKIIANQVGENNSLFSVTNKKTFKVKYKFISADSSKSLPEGVTNQVPQEETGKENGEDVNPSTSTFNSVADGDGTWTFTSWDKQSDKINKGDVTFTGTWTFTPKEPEPTTKYKVTYEFTTSGTDKQLPQGVKDLLPGEETGKENGTKVEPSTKTFADVTTDEGTWTFKGWKPTEQTIDGADVKFIGTWTFTPKAPEPETKYKVTYEFKSGTEGKELPAAINGYKPTDNTEYADGARVNAKEPTQTTYEDTTNNGTWTFTKWDANSKTIDGADVKFVGTWTFTPKAPEQETKYKVTYEFVSGTEGKTLPAAIEGYKPTDDTNYADGVTVNAKQPTQKSYEAEDGTWTFTKWDANSKTIDGADVKFVGTWTFTPKEKPNPEDPKPPVTNIITEYVDIYGNELIPSKDGDQPVEVIPGYEFIETRRTEKVVSHIYKKIEREDPNPWFPLFPRVEREEKVETHPVNAVVPEKTLLNKEDHKAYMFGYPDWTFLPNNNMTRAEVTAMFARLLKNYPSTNVKYNLPYSDVFEGDWYYPAVGFMTENNIIKGYEDGTFRPNAPITRAEFATIASKFDEIIGGDVKGFYDVPASHWALKYINSAYERGWVTGYEDGSFRPDRNITRAEVVTVTNKMLIRYADVDYVRAHRDILINFKDLDESHWAYFNIMEATHGHDFMRKANGKDETWERLNGEAFIFPDLRYEDR